MSASTDRVIITEGQAKIEFAKENLVFYNKVQVFNRDLSILVIKTFNELRKQEIAQVSYYYNYDYVLLIAIFITFY